MVLSKILVVHNDYQQAGGEQVAVEAQLTLLREHGHNVMLYERDNAEIANYRLWQKAIFFPQTIFSWKTWQEVSRVVRNERPDVAHVHNVFPLISPAVYWVLKKSGVPIVQTVYNFRFACPNALFYTRGQICERCKYGNTVHAIIWRCYRQSYLLSALYALAIGLHRRWGTFEMIDRFVAPSEFTAQKIVESGLTTQDKVSVLEYFLPHPLPDQKLTVDSEQYILYLGRLSSEKGVEILLQAARGLPHLKVRIAGDGPLTVPLQAMARSWGLRHLEFLGRVVGNEKWRLLRRALTTVVPSLCYENSPFSALESLAVATPVVASNLGSLPYVVEDGKSGLLFHPGDGEDLREKLAWLAAHPEEALAMGRYGRQVVETKYCAGAHYKRLIEIYSEVVG